ncbi:MAG: hypothetical protein LBH96_02740 [Candidatus Peribacteria bacterium]|nr:hypothetical protein [Candidatus Peribacteria bacterium]
MDDSQHLLYGFRKLHSLAKKEEEIVDVYKKMDELKMQWYIQNISPEQADRRDIRKQHRWEEQLITLEKDKEKLLQTKESVAAYELRKIANYAQQWKEKEFIITPSVQKNSRHLRDEILSRKTLLLSGPVGTGKTKMAINIDKEILKAKKEAGQISNEDYHKLMTIPIINGNEESSIRDLQSKPVQMLGESAAVEEKFVYDEGLLSLCLKYGIPLIVDESNRTPPNFLSSLKKYWAMSGGDWYRDPITNTSFMLSGPLQVIMTANEGSKYSAHTNKMQDQIEREVQREYIGYLPKEEIYDIFKAKLYVEP